MICMTYEEDTPYLRWQDIWIDNCDLQNEIALRARRQLVVRERILEADEAGQDSSSLAPNAPIIC